MGGPIVLEERPTADPALESSRLAPAGEPVMADAPLPAAGASAAEVAPSGGAGAGAPAPAGTSATPSAGTHDGSRAPAGSGATSFDATSRDTTSTVTESTWGHGRTTRTLDGDADRTGRDAPRTEERTAGTHDRHGR